jgi:hypothetical protein
VSGFDLAGFRGAALAPRTATVAVAELAPWFGEAPAQWIVRGLTGEEIARANEAASRATLVASAVEALAAGSAAKAEQVEAMRGILGYGTDTPADLVKRLDHLVAGSVEPAIDREIAVRLFNAYPVVAYQLTNKILELTGLGADPGKAPHSTSTAESPSP